MLATVSGDLATAEVHCAEMAAMFEARSLPEALILQSAALLAIGRERGNTAWMLDAAMAADAKRPAAGAVNVALAFIRFLNGQQHEAIAALDAVDLAEIPNDGGWPICVSFLAEIAASIGSVEQARGLRVLLENKSNSILLTGGIVLGAADRLLALIDERLGDQANADQLFASAVELHERFGARAWTARTQLDWAEARLARGEATRVVVHLDAAEAAIGDLELGESSGRLAEFRARLSK
jgi:hypothetical protein